MSFPRPFPLLLLLLLLLLPFTGCGGTGSGSGAGAGSGGGATGSGVTGGGSGLPASNGLLVGVATRIISPTRWETWNDVDGNSEYDEKIDTYNDAGGDHLFDWQEPGAFGPDGAPGRAGIDDNGNGFIDEIAEYMSPGSDD